MKRYILTLLISTSLWLSCYEEVDKTRPAGTGKVPENVENVVVEPTKGGALVTYKAPTDISIVSVVAKINGPEGYYAEKMVSIFAPALEIEGLPNTSKYTISLTTRDLDGNESDNLEKEFSPKLPHYIETFNSIKIEPVLGAMDYSWENPDSVPLTFFLMYKDTLTGKYIESNIIASNRKKQTFREIEIPFAKTNFAVRVADKWGNMSVLKDTLCSPKPEYRLPPESFKKLILFNDTNLSNWGAKYTNLYDGDPKTAIHSPVKPEQWPVVFSVDLGQEVKITRLVMWQRQDDMRPNVIFNMGTPKTFELFYANERPAQDGNWDDWTPAGEYSWVKPSGLPLGKVSDADIAAVYDGCSVFMPDDSPSARYIRLKITENFNPSFRYSVFTELGVFGVFDNH